MNLITHHIIFKYFKSTFHSDFSQWNRSYITNCITINIYIFIYTSRLRERISDTCVGV